MGLLDSAEAVISLETGEGALLGAAKKRGHKVAVGIDFKETGLRYALLPLFGHPAAIGGILPLEQFRLLFAERRAAVAHYAAGTPAGLIIAAEVLGDDFGGDKYVTYLYYGGSSVRHIFCKIKQ